MNSFSFTLNDKNSLTGITHPNIKVEKDGLLVQPSFVAADEKNTAKVVFNFLNITEPISLIVDCIINIIMPNESTPESSDTTSFVNIDEEDNSLEYPIKLCKNEISTACEKGTIIVQGSIHVDHFMQDTQFTVEGEDGPKTIFFKGSPDENRKFDCVFYKYMFNSLDDKKSSDCLCKLEVTTGLPFSELKKAIVEGSKIKYDPTKQCMLLFDQGGFHPKFINKLYEGQKTCFVYIYDGVSEEELENMKYCYTIDYGTANNYCIYRGPLLASKSLNAQEILEELKKRGVKVEEKEYQAFEVIERRKTKKVSIDYEFTSPCDLVMIKHI